MDVYTLVVIITFVAFITLAALLLFPVYFFLKRQERVSEEWTPEALSRRLQELQESETEGEPTSSE